MKTKKLLFVSHLANLRGGAERSLLALIKDAAKKGYVCHVSLPEAGEFSEELSKQQIDFSIDSDWWVIRTLNDNTVIDTTDTANQIAVAMSGFYSFLTNFQPDVVITNTITVPLCAYVAKALNIPNILFVCELPDDRNGIVIPTGKEYLFDLYDYTFDAVKYNSHFTKSEYKDLLTSKPDTIVYPPIQPIHTDTFLPVTLPLKQLNIIVPGVINEHKNQLEVLRSLQILTQKGVDFSLTLLGDQSNTSYVQKLQLFTKENLPDGSVRFLDYTPKPYDEISKHDIVIVPSLNEAFGRVTIEAMYLERLTVGANTGGTKEIISDKKTGFLYKSGSPESLADVLIDITNQTPKSLRTVTRAAKKSVEKQFFTSHQFDNFYTLLESKELKKNAVQNPVFNPLIASIIRTSYLEKKIAEYADSLENTLSQVESKKRSIRSLEKELNNAHSRIEYKIGSRLRKISKKKYQ